MATYVMTDIHGMYDKFIKMLEQINFTPSDNLLILGDNVDRGPHSMEVLDHIEKTPNIESLMGNHELMMINEVYKLNLGQVGDWYRNGGDITSNNYHKFAEEHGLDRAMQLLDACAQWKFYKILTVNGRQFLCIHAGYWMASPERYKTHYNSDIETLLKDTTNIDKVWLREEFYLRRGLPNLTTLFGHTPTKNLHGKFAIWHDPVHEDKINLDCGVAYGGRLACLRLDDMQEFYV